MANLDWSQCPAVESIPRKAQWCMGITWYSDPVLTRVVVD